MNLRKLAEIAKTKTDIFKTEEAILYHFTDVFFDEYNKFYFTPEELESCEIKENIINNKEI